MKIVLSIILFALSLYVNASTYEYNDYIGDKLRKRSVEIKDYKDGYIINTVTDDKRSTSIIDKEFVLIKEIEHDLKTDEIRTIEIEEDKIYYNKDFIGTFDSKSGDPRANAEFISPWLRKKSNKLKFFAVKNKRDRKGNIIKGEMDKIPLYLKKIGKEKVLFNGKKVDAVKVLFTIDNAFFSLFWKVHHWYRLSDGVLLKYENIKTPPGDPVLKGYLKGVTP